jgi:nitrogen fixation/metabolism regulation signal transduction histidine kinase
MRRIRTRLVIALLIVALLPALPLSLAVRNLLERSFNPNVHRTLQEALDAGLAEARGRLQELKQETASLVRKGWQPLVAKGDPALCRAGADTVLFLAEIEAGLKQGSRPQPLVHPDLADTLRQLRVRGLQQLAGQVREGQKEKEKEMPAPGQWLSGPWRVQDCLAIVLAGPGGGTVTFAKVMPADLLERADRLTAGLGLLGLLQQDRSRVLRSYIAPFLLVYAALILLAVSVGAVLARRIARPVEALVEGTQRVAAGDLQTRVATAASGEIGELVNAFNLMVGRLARQRGELARLERQAAWRDLARILAHEIKNPLTPILLAVQSAREGYCGEDPAYASLLNECEQIVREEVERLRLLVKEFSEFARLPQPKLVRGELGPLLGELVRLYGEDKVDCTCTPPDLSACFDPDELRRALVNLIDNGLAACKGAGRPEQVVVAAIARGDAVTIEVRDGGPGIAPENMARIFAPDFSTKKEGMGLGLPIVEGIVRGHDGTIEVMSNPGEGATFRILLPPCRAQVASPSSTSSEGAG